MLGLRNGDGELAQCFGGRDGSRRRELGSLLFERASDAEAKDQH